MGSRLLYDAVKSLSLPADEQLALLSGLGCPGVIDELALQFHDQAVTAEQLMQAGEIEYQQLLLVKEIDAILARMSGQENAALWTNDALKQSPLWEEIRRRANRFFGP